MQRAHLRAYVAPDSPHLTSRLKRRPSLAQQQEQSASNKLVYATLGIANAALHTTHMHTGARALLIGPAARTRLDEYAPYTPPSRVFCRVARGQNT